jgi:hypothetical protein
MRQLGKLGMPILTIIGGRDVALDSRETRARLQRTVPQAEICFIERGYHFFPRPSVARDGFSGAECFTGEMLMSAQHPKSCSIPDSFFEA